MQHARVYMATLARIAELTKREANVYLFLLACQNAKTGQCNPSRQSIAAGLGIGLNDVWEGLRGLTAAGWIEPGDGREGFGIVDIDKVPENGTFRKRKRSGKRNKDFRKTEAKVPENGTQLPENGSAIYRNLKQCSEQTTEQTIEQTAEAARDRDRSAIWTFGVKLLTDAGSTEKSARTLLGKLAKESNERILAEAIGAAMYKNPVDPKTFIIGAVRHRSNGRAGERFPAADPNADVDVTVVDFEPRPAPGNLPAADRKLWTGLRDRLRSRLNRDVFSTWFGDAALRFDGVDKQGRLMLRAGRVTYDWINLYYADLLDELLSAEDGPGYKIIWEIEDAETCEMRKVTAG